MRLGTKDMIIHTKTGEKKRPPSSWQVDYNKYGRDAFKVYVIEENVQPSDRKKREDFWIRKYKARDPDYGYNLRYEKRKPPAFEIEPGAPPLPD